MTETDEIYDSKKLPQGIQIDQVGGNESDDILLKFEKISGSGSTTRDVGEIFDIRLSYKGSESPVLQKNITYYMESYIVDY